MPVVDLMLLLRRRLAIAADALDAERRDIAPATRYAPCAAAALARRGDDKMSMLRHARGA